MATAAQHVSEMAKTAGVESVAQLFKKRIAEDGARTAARYKVGGKWTDLSWSALAAQAEEVAFGLVSIGIKKGEMVSILAGTRIEWTHADLGIALAGGIAVPIYQSNTPEECQFILENAGAVTVVAEDEKQLLKLTAMKSRLPKIHHVILIDGKGDGNWTLSLDDLKARGRELRAKTPGEIDQRVAGGKRDELTT